MVAEPHLTDLPLGLARRLAGIVHRLGRLLRRLDLLSLQHLVEPDDQGLQLRLLACQRQRPAGAGGEEEEAALAGLAHGRDGDAVHRVELVDRHRLKTRRWLGFASGDAGNKIKVSTYRSNPSHREE